MATEAYFTFHLMLLFPSLQKLNSYLTMVSF